MPLHLPRALRSVAAASKSLSSLTSQAQAHKPTHLLHLHLPTITPYPTASAVQERIIQRHFAYKDALSASRHSASPGPHPSRPPPPPPPSPLVLTFSTPPTYTVGRRYLTTNPLPAAQIAYLRGLTPSPTQPTITTTHELAAFYPSLRGGDLTYHSPGQLTAYIILDLRAHALTPRCYVRLLETSVMATCARLGVPNTMTTSDPGVWISTSTSTHKPVPTDRKVCALGVQVRRGVTGHGIGLNIHDHPATSAYSYSTTAATTANHSSGQSLSTGYLSWGFSRIVACGLEGKSVTWLAREGADPDISVAQAGQVFAGEVAGALGLGSGEDEEGKPKAVTRITLDDIEGW